MKNLAGRTALITGAAGGIGRAIAQSLAARGMKVAISDVDDDRLQAGWKAMNLPAGQGHAVRLDVTDAEAWAAAVIEVERVLGPIDLLIHNAGIAGGDVVAKEDPRRWHYVLDVNVYGPFLGCRAVLPSMLARSEPAHVMFISSIAGLYPAATLSSFVAGKHALMGLSDCLRSELAGSNVSLTLFVPGVTKTDFNANSREVIERYSEGASPPPGIELKAALMDAEIVAERAVQAILAEEYLVFTHPAWKELLTRHFGERLAAFGVSADPHFVDDSLAALKGHLVERLAKR